MEAFDPLSYENLGASISRALDDQPVIPLDDLEQFPGSGVYALYYSGPHDAYAPLAESNQADPGSWAIYIGKADAENARKGDPDQRHVLEGPKLWRRIVKDHRKSIDQAENLDTRDFSVRYLVVAPTWIQLAEIIAIRMHKPVWNALIDGFGNHAPGSGRKNMVRPRWDTLHPGRPWAPRLRERQESSEDIEREILGYLDVHRPE